MPAERDSDRLSEREMHGERERERGARAHTWRARVCVAGGERDRKREHLVRGRDASLGARRCVAGKVEAGTVQAGDTLAFRPGELVGQASPIT